MHRVVALLLLVIVSGLLPQLGGGSQAQAPQTATERFVAYLPLMVGAQTGNPGNPSEPGNPAEPGNPGNPGNPGEPGNPPPATGSFFIPGEAPTRNFEVEYDAQGRMHMVFVRHTRTEGLQEVVYGLCGPGADCDNPTNWQTVVVHQGTIGTVQLEVTGDGRPRLALQDEQTVNSFRLVYLECNQHCISAAGWQGLGLSRGLQSIDAFLEFVSQRWFAITPTGQPRMLVSIDEGSFYLACDANCLDASGQGWSITALDTTGDQFLTNKLYGPVLKIGPDGRAHILGRISRPELVYLTCSAGCDQGANWQRTTLADAVNGQGDQLPAAIFPSDHDLEIDRTGMIVVAFGGVTAGENGVNRAYLWRCTANCSDLSGWSGRPFPNTPSGDLDLAIDPQNRPYFVIAGKLATEERIAQIATCAAGDCYDFYAAWSARVVSSSNEMEAEYPMRQPPQTPALCSVATTSWEHSANRLVFDPAGRMRLVTSAVATSICQPGMDEWIDQWGTKKRGRTIDVWVLNARARWTIIP